MILFPGLMPTANLPEISDAPPPAAPRFLRPAEYYSGPAPHRILPRWATFGCGALALLLLAGIFLGANAVSAGRFTAFFDLVVGMSIGEMKGMYAADVAAPQKAAFDREVDRIREGLRGGTISIQSLQPLLVAMRSAMADNKVDRAELEGMTTVARKIRPGKTPSSKIMTTAAPPAFLF